MLQAERREYATSLYTKPANRYAGEANGKEEDDLMAANSIEQTELTQATKDYCALHEATEKTGKIVLKTGEEVAVSLRDGKIVCPDANITEALIGLIMEQREPTKGMVPVRNGRITSRSQAGSIPGSGMNAAQAIQTMQAGKDLTYTVQKKAAPNATMALMAATDAHIDLEEINSILTDELASSTIRASRKDRHVDATVSIRKADFINLLAWKEVQAQEAKKNYILDDSDPMNIALPNGFPRIKPDATINVAIQEEIGNRWEKRRAMVHIYLTAMQQWIFQQRQCQTKAKRNATIQMLTSSGNPMEAMDEEELADEAMEAKIVEGAKA